MPARTDLPPASPGLGSPVNLNFPLLVVSEARSRLQGVLQSTTTYFYQGARADTSGRGFLGFRKTRATTMRMANLPTGGVQALKNEIETLYRQEFPYTGMPELVTQKVNDVLVLKTEYLDFAYTRADGSRAYFPRSGRVKRSSYDPGNGELLTTVEQSLAFDSYGNVTADTVTTRKAGLSDVFVVANVKSYSPADVTSWVLGFLKSEQVTYQRTDRPDVVRSKSFDYDASGFLKQEIVEPNSPDLRVQTDYSRDVYGNVSFVAISGAGNTAYPDTAIQSRTTESRYEAGPDYPAGVFKTKEINPLGHAINRSYDAATGAVLTETDPNNSSVIYERDSLGRETKRINPDATVATVAREVCSTFSAVGSGTTGCETGEFIKATLARTGAAATYVFTDGLGREVRKVSRAFDGVNYIISRTEYDEAGRVKRTSKPAFNTVGYGSLLWTAFEYDAAGRTVKQTQPGGRLTTTAYNGFVTTTTNPNNQARAETRNVAGEVVQIKDANNQVLTYEMDALGRITKAIDPKGNQLVFTLDKLGRKTQQQDPDLGTWSYRYNVLGQLVWQKDAKNQVTTFAYDKLGRLLARSEPDLNSNWTWDTAANGIGRLAKLTGDNAFERNYAYDSVGRPQQVTTKKTIDPFALSTDADFVYGTSYDVAGRPEVITYPTGFGYKNVYDANGYLLEVRDKTSNAVYWQANARDAEGHVTRETLGNGIVTDRKYKPETSYLDTVQAGVLSNTTLVAGVQNDAYSFDALGNLTSRSQYFGSTSLTEAFGYDALNRVTSANLLNVSPKTAAYDELGNITSRSDIGTYSYANCGGTHRVCGVAGSLSANYTYDANGNQLAGRNNRSIVWTSYNYPLQISQGSTTESFSYSPERERVRRVSVENGQATTTVYLSPRIDLGGTFEKTVRPGGGSQATHYVYADGRVVANVTRSLLAPFITISAAPNPVTIGKPVTIRASLSTTTFPAGSVTFKDGSIVLATSPVVQSGSSYYAEYITSSLAAGVHALTATYNGNASNPVVTSPVINQVVDKNSTTTVLSSSDNPSFYSSPLTLTATVASGAGVNVPTGTVTFKDGANVMGEAVLALSGSSYIATYTVPSLPVGNHAITASYSGDAASSASISTVLNQKSSQLNISRISLSPSVGSLRKGQDLVLTTTLTFPNKPFPPTGNVTIRDSLDANNNYNYTLSSMAASGSNYVVNSSMYALGAGVHAFTVQYSGDANYESSSSSLSLTAYDAENTTTVGIMTTPSTISQEQPLSLTVKVSGATPPTGIVYILDGTYAPSPVFVGQAQLSLVGSDYVATYTGTGASILPGQHSLYAYYLGDLTHMPSLSAAIPVTVTGQVSSTVTLTSDLNPSNQGTGTVTATVASPVAPTGTVTFKDGSTVMGTGTLSRIDRTGNYIGTNEAIYTATYPMAALSAGAHSLTAIYGGDAYHTPATSMTLNQVVNGSATTTTTLSSNANPAPSGSSFRLTATVVGGSGGLYPNGSVTFKDGSTVLGSAVLSRVGSTNTAVAVFNTSSNGTSVGTHSMTAIYAGSTTPNVFLASTSPALSLVVGTKTTSGTTTTLVMGPNPATTGTPVTLTATITSGTGYTPTGTVSFIEYPVYALVGTAEVTLVGSVYKATLTTSALSTGSHNILAYYSGDVWNRSSNSTAIGQAITSAASSSLTRYLAGLPFRFDIGEGALLCPPPRQEPVEAAVRQGWIFRRRMIVSPLSACRGMAA